MPRVRTQRASGRARRVCGRIGCGKEIQKGEQYHTWSFRYGGRQVRCMEHPPLQSELTQSRMSEVYAAIENFNVNFANGAETVQEVVDGLEEVATAAEEVMEAYREAAEHFGGQGENAERADELEGWVSELQGFSPDEPDEEFDEEEVRRELAQDLFGVTPEELDEEQTQELQDAFDVKRQEWEEEHEDDNRSKIDEAVEEARELLDALSL